MKRNKKMLTAVTLIAVIVLVQACRKFDFFSKESKKPEFTVAQAKEWYYGVFKGSAEWLNYDRQKNGVKLPDWKRGKYFKVGNTEFVEFPLIKAKTKIEIASKGDLSTGDAVKIVNSSLSRIVFVKTNAKVTIREIDYVPDFNYLKNAGFDISDNYIAEMNKEFTGTLILKTWDGVEISENYMNNGKLTGKKQKKKTSGNLRMQACEDFLIILYERNCYTVTNGDVVTTECTDWEETDRWIEPVCDSDPECEGMTPAECACMLFGCNGGGDPDGDPSGLDDQQTENAIIAMFNSYTQMEETPVVIEGNSTSVGADPVTGSVTWEVAKHSFGTWSIQAITNYSYVHDRFLTVNMTYIDTYNMTMFSTANSNFIGSNIFIESTWTEANKVDQVLNNNTANTHGQANISGTIRHRLRHPLPVSGGVLDVTNYVQGNTLTFYPR